MDWSWSLSWTFKLMCFEEENVGPRTCRFLTKWKSKKQKKRKFERLETLFQVSAHSQRSPRFIPTHTVCPSPNPNPNTPTLLLLPLLIYVPLHTLTNLKPQSSKLDRDNEMGYSKMLLGLVLLITLAATSTAQPAAVAPTFKCTTTKATCHSLIDYVSPNTTTISTIQSLFQIKRFHDLLGANGLSNSTSPNKTLEAKERIRIPFTCLCENGTGLSNRSPKYKVKKDDGLYHIAAEIFSGLTTSQEVARVNGIPDPDKIEVGQELWIPLPCSCDEVAGAKVVHYGHVVETGSSVEKIAMTYGTTEDILLQLNGIVNASQLLAGQVLDVPLKGFFTFYPLSIFLFFCLAFLLNPFFNYKILYININSCVNIHTKLKNIISLNWHPSHLFTSIYKDFSK